MNFQSTRRGQLALLALAMSWLQSGCHSTWEQSSQAKVNTKFFGVCARSAVARTGITEIHGPESNDKNVSFALSVPGVRQRLDAKIVLVDKDLVKVAVYGPKNESEEVKSKVQPVLDKVVAELVASCGTPSEK
jgi:hypothetical protein